MSFAAPRSRPSSAGSRPRSAGPQRGGGNFDSLPTAHLIELKRSVDGKLAARRSRKDDDDAWDARSQATVDYNHGRDTSFQRPLSPAVSRAGSVGGGTPAQERVTYRPSSAGRLSQRPSSADRLRQSVGEQKVVAPRRPITPTYPRREAERGPATVHYGGDGWERPSSARSRDRTAGIRDDVDIFSNDRKPRTTATSMVRPHSARPATVTGKIGGITGSRLVQAPLRVQPQPPKAGAFRVRKDLMKGVTLLRRFYDRGDLPICVKHCPQENEINWKVEVDKLDFHYYLPIFFDGLRDKEEPYFFFARRAILDMVDKGPHRVVAVLPQLIIFVKNALNTRDPDIVQTTLKILQTMVKADDRIGESLVPYYRQLLPIFNLLKGKNRNSGDSIDYSQRKRNNVGELIHETLEMLEMYGGPDAYINIKYMIPTYESCMVV